MDGAHPPGAAHHHKIVVIDDAVAFCGGIDMTGDRWDTPEHRDNAPAAAALSQGAPMDHGMMPPRRSPGQRPRLLATMLVSGGDTHRERFWYHRLPARTRGPKACPSTWTT
ncbi:hypothetical protein ACFQY9_26225 [Microvirga aerilata]|uniref:hypothetical protein n=1 Tax=Microvirga aerilata TaxID=670292 RepID=UPI003642DD5B